MPKTREIMAALNAVKKARRKFEVMKKVYPERLEKELEFTGWSVVTDWYSTYDPWVYERKGDLLNAYKIKVNKKTGKYSVDFGPQYMKYNHHQSNAIVYNNAFVEGYHGGSRGEGASSPYWRSPIPLYETWGQPAIRSFSPYEVMTDKMNDVISEIKSDVNKDIKEIERILDVKLLRG